MPLLREHPQICGECRKEFEALLADNRRSLRRAIAGPSCSWRDERQTLR
jgi:hypothetical protein